jgi:hypothetical protein
LPLRWRHVARCARADSNAFQASAATCC